MAFKSLKGDCMDENGRSFERIIKYNGNGDLFQAIKKTILKRHDIKFFPRKSTAKYIHEYVGSHFDDRVMTKELFDKMIATFKIELCFIIG